MRQHCHCAYKFIWINLEYGNMSWNINLFSCAWLDYILGYIQILWDRICFIFQCTEKWELINTLESNFYWIRCDCSCRTMSPLAQLYSTSTMERHYFDHCLMILNTKVGKNQGHGANVTHLVSKCKLMQSV